MVVRLFVLVAGLAVTIPAAAQSRDVEGLRSDMYEAAAALHSQITGGPGPLDAMLGIDRAAALALEADHPDRENWQFWPTQRAGLTLEAMSADQRTLVHRMLRTILSSAGYLKVAHIMQLEQVLEASDRAGFPRAVDHYKLVLFGAPQADGPWSWRFEGHHVSLSVAVSPDGIRVTPSFMGSNPAEVRSGPLAGFRVHGGVEEMARDLVGSLSAAQRAVAVVAEAAPSEIFTTNLRRPREQWDAWLDSVQPEGIAVAELNEVQRHWVQLILGEVIGNYRPAIAAHYEALLDPESLSFAWMGSMESGEPHYFRLQGDSFLYEYDNVQNGGNHVHAVWRDKSADFGRDILGQHYQAAHTR